MLSSPTEKLNEWVEKHSMSFDARGLLHATPKKDADGRCWHPSDVLIRIERVGSLAFSGRAYDGGEPTYWWRSGCRLNCINSGLI